MQILLKGIGCYSTNWRAIKFSLQDLCCVFCDNTSAWWWMIIVLYLYVCVWAMKLRCPTWRRSQYVQHQHCIISVRSGTYQFPARRGGGDKDGERVRKRGRERRKREMVFIWSREFIVCEFAVVAQIAHFPYFVLLKIASLSIWKAITLIGNVTSETELWKNINNNYRTATLSEHMGRITCTTSILLPIPVYVLYLCEKT